MVPLSDGHMTQLLDDERPVVQKRAIQTLGRLKIPAIPALLKVLKEPSRTVSRLNAVWALTQMEDPKAREAIYAALPAGWTWPFRGLGYMFYAIGAVAAIFGLSNFTNSRFLQYFGTAAGFGVFAYLFHRWASDVAAFGWSLLLRVIVLVSAAGALPYLLLSIPFLFLKPQEPTSPSAMGNGAPKSVDNTSGSRSRFELIAGIIIALLALLTAAVPLIKAWLKVQD